jgi:hypothetical protein
MTGAALAQLLIMFGPTALKWIKDLAAVWTTTLTTDQVITYCNLAEKSYDEYIAEAKAKFNPVP